MQYNLTFSTDVNYLPYLFVLCQSIVDSVETRESNDQDELVFNVLVDDSVNLNEVQDKALHFVERNKDCGITHRFVWHLVDHKLFSNFNSMTRDGLTSFSTYYRIIIDHILPESVKYTAYLDIDMLVLRDIRCLFDQHKLEGKVLGAVLDPSICALNYPDAKSYVYATYKDNPSKFIKVSKQKYFNAGLLLINLTEWRKLNLRQSCLELASKLNLTYHDQDLLNILCEGKVEFLDFAWNFQPAMFYVLYNKESYKYDITSAFTPNKHWECLTPNAEDFEKSASSPYIIHFNGSKPWNNEPTFNVPFASDVPTSNQLNFYKQQWFLIDKKVTEYPSCHSLNVDAIDRTAIRLNTFINTINKKRRKDRNILLSLIAFSVFLNIVTIILSLLNVI